MMFADDIAIRSVSLEQVEANLEKWRYDKARRSRKVSRWETECVNERGRLNNVAARCGGGEGGGVEIIGVNCSKKWSVY